MSNPSTIFKSFCVVLKSLAVLALFGCLLCQSAMAQEKSESSDGVQQTKEAPKQGRARGSEEKKQKKKKQTRKITDQRSEDLMSFVQEHHPELEFILAKLKDGKQRQYQQAMRGLDQTVSRLENIRQRSPERYPSSLAYWKLESRIKVAAARYKLDETNENRDKLKSLLVQRYETRLKRLKEDRNNIADRLKKMDARIEELESGKSSQIERRIKSATRTGKKKNETKADKDG
jgi:hypothetical protein